MTSPKFNSSLNANNVSGSNAGSAKQAAKQVLYVDVDDEITTIIDKMNSSDARVIALVLPKRASVFQSVVNMKLLKHRADAAKKNLVLITSEAGLMPLAGIAGLHVAPTLQSKPQIPSGSISQTLIDNNEETASMESEPDPDGDAGFDPSKNANMPVGALASGSAVAGEAAALDGAAAAGATGAASGLQAPGSLGRTVESSIELDNSKAGLMSKLKSSGSDSPDDQGENGGSQKPGKAKTDKKLKVPNFFSFRKRLIFGGLALVLLAVGWYYAFMVLPKATVTIKTDSSDISSNLDITLDTAAAKIDTDKLIVPAQSKQEQKSNTQQVAATGQDNKGDKATGSVVMSASVCGVPSTPDDIPAGTGVSSGGSTFITQKNTSFSYDGIGAGCIRFKSDSIAVTAQKGGAAYNLSSADFSVAGRSDVKASGTTSGGTDNIVKVIQQADIDSAKQKLTAAQDQTTLKRQLQQNLETDNLFALPDTFNTGTPNVNTNSNVGDEAENVTVTQSVTYTMFGVRKDDLSKLVEASAAKQINTAKQSLLDDGIKDAKVTVPTPGAGPQLKINLAVTSTAGPKLDVEAIKKDIVGMKSGNVQDRIKQSIGVTEVDVHYSPFWVTKAPKASRTTVVFEKSNSAGGASDSTSGGATSGSN